MIKTKNRRKHSQENVTNKGLVGSWPASIELAPQAYPTNKITCKLRDTVNAPKENRNSVDMVSNLTPAMPVSVELMSNRPEYPSQPPRGARNHPKSTKSRA